MKKLFIVNLVLVFLALILQIILPDNTLGLVFLFQLAIFPIIGIFALIFYFSKRKTIGENKTFFYSFLFLLIGIIYFILLNYVFWAKFVEEGQWGLFIVSAIAAFNSSIITWEIIISFFIFIN